MKNKRGGLLGFMFFFFVMLVFLSLFLNWHFGVLCKVEAWFNEDYYCVDSTSTNSTSTYNHNWKIRSHEQDIANQEKARLKRERLFESLDKKTSCYGAGYDVNKSFDLFKDYGLSCKKIAYINDHLMDNFEKKNAGYIDGYYLGLLSYGSVDGQMYQYVNDRVLATGKLVENIYYHVDCENSTNKWFIENDYWNGGKILTKKDTTVLDYFTEEEFVMQYVDRCL